MSTPASRASGSRRGSVQWLTVVVGLGMVLIDVAAVYVLFASLNVPALAAYGATAVVAVVVGGSFLSVVVRALVGSPDEAALGSESTVARATDVIFAVTVLTGVTVLLGSVGGLLLTVVASLGGPDPETADGERLRTRLLEWAERNREFVRSDGRSELPLSP